MLGYATAEMIKILHKMKKEDLNYDASMESDDDSSDKISEVKIGKVISVKQFNKNNFTHVFR